MYLKIPWSIACPIIVYHSEEKGDSRVAADALLCVGMLCAADDVEFTTSSAHDASPIVTMSFPAFI